MLTMRHALDRFVAEERARAPDRVDRLERALSSLGSFLESYGYQYVDEEVVELVDEEDDLFDDGDGADFAERHSPEMLPEAMPEFLFEWLIRDDPASPDETRETAEVAARLMEWLADERIGTEADAREAAALAMRAADEVPRAKRLAALLRPLAGQVPDRPPTSEDDVVEDFFRIVRLEPGRLWFEGDVGPIEVPEEASGLAEVGWWVNLEAARLAGSWYLSEVGNVYPLLAEGDEVDEGDWGTDGRSGR